VEQFRDGVTPRRPTDFKMKEGYVPGSYANLEGLSPWTKDKLSPEEYLRKEVVELNNGRLAMLACIGLWAQELVQGGQPVMFTLLVRACVEINRRSYGDNIASMAWGVRHLISTQEKVATYEIPALFQEFHQ
jgi:hypothetical protein